MKRQKSCGPRLGKLVHQLPGVVTFAYDLRFRRVIARWKGIVEEIHFGGSIMPLAIIEHLDLKKPSFRPSKWPRKLNLLKIVNCQNCQKTILSQSEKVGGHQYPPGSARMTLSMICLPSTYPDCSFEMINGKIGLSLLAMTFVIILKITLQRDIGRNYFGCVTLSSSGIRVMKVAFRAERICPDVRDSSTTRHTSSLIMSQQ
jgi:hypothetical protein